MTKWHPVPNHIPEEKQRFILGNNYILDIPIILLHNDSFIEYIDLYSKASKQNSELTRLTGSIMNLASDLYIRVDFEPEKRPAKASLFINLDNEFETVLKELNVLKFEMGLLYQDFNSDEVEFINNYLTI